MLPTPSSLFSYCPPHSHLLLSFLLFLLSFSLLSFFRSVSFLLAALLLFLPLLSFVFYSLFPSLLVPRIFLFLSHLLPLSLFPPFFFLPSCRSSTIPSLSFFYFPFPLFLSPFSFASSSFSPFCLSLFPRLPFFFPFPHTTRYSLSHCSSPFYNSYGSKTGKCNVKLGAYGNVASIYDNMVTLGGSESVNEGGIPTHVRQDR